MKTIFSCYILKCQNGKYYTGSTLTRTIQDRFNKHKNGEGSKWCYQFPPSEIIKTIDGLTSPQAFQQENVECLRIMRENQDIQCCRGGDYLFPLGTDWWGRHILVSA